MSLAPTGLALSRGLRPRLFQELPLFTKYPFWRKWFGQRSERFAARYLRTLGYRILAHNQQDRRGEIDLLAWENNTLVIVEVRSSETRSFQEIAATVNYEKQRRLTEAARRFVHQKHLKMVAIRFDVVAVRWPENAEPECQLYRNAFPATGRYQLGG